MVMLGLPPAEGGLLKVLCLGAHCDDIEIGCGGTLAALARSGRPMRVDWVVFSSDGVREAESRCAARALLGPVESTFRIMQFRDGFFPYAGEAIKDCFESLKRELQPDLILTHYGGDRHQDHRLICELTWNTFRRHLILEYEIPKYDGDLGSPNVFVPLPLSVCRHKWAVLMDSFASQAGHQWFTKETFQALMRLRGVECNAPEGYAEAFYGRKLPLQL